ncbi:hypothetical protein RB597_005364 [Gaeumannomyces tritici]
MGSYDSDSSGEDQDFTETNVLLGYTSKDAGSETVSRLGGRPDWLVADKPPTAALARCKVCKDLTVLLLQLNGELPERFPGHERRIYVFACRKKSCRRQAGSIRAIRGLRVSAAAAAAAAAAAEKKVAAERQKVAAAKEASKPVTSTGLGESLFGVKAPSGGANPFAAPGANPFSSAPQASAANPFSTKPQAPEPAKEEKQKENAQKEEPKATKSAAELPQTFAEKLALNNPQAPSGPPPPPEPWPAESEPGQPRPYPVSWIAEAEYETLDPTPMPSVPTGPTVMELDEEAAGGGSSSGGGKGKEDKEVFESSMDTDFQKFADRVGQNPDQVIRYEYAGAPLLYSRGDDVGRALGAADDEEDGGRKIKAAGGMPPCANCGAARVFEVQLTPQAIADLEAGGEDGLDGMDWGTVIVGVCSRDCQERAAGDGETGYLEEWVGVQWEELMVKR